MAVRVRNRYFQPIFCVATSHGGVTSPCFSGQEFCGTTTMATMAAATDPMEKKTDSAVNKYRLDAGMFSRNRVPSVGMLP